MATTAVQKLGWPPNTRVEAIPSMSSRLRVMPCWKITVGHALPAGTVQGPPDFGRATRIGIMFWATVALGRRLVGSVLMAVSPPAALCQESVTASVAPVFGTVR